MDLMDMNSESASATTCATRHGRVDGRHAFSAPVRETPQWYAAEIPAQQGEVVFGAR